MLQNNIPSGTPCLIIWASKSGANSNSIIFSFDKRDLGLLFAGPEQIHF